MPNAKISLISLSANKTFLASYLLNDFSNGTLKLLKGEELEHSKIGSVNLTFPTSVTLLLLSNIIKKVAILITYFN